MDGEWGFCRYCAYEVAVEDGVILEHERYAGSYDRLKCPGSGRKVTKQPGPEAQPIRLVRLTKTLTQINSRKAKRDHLIRTRAARERREGNVIELRPTSLTVTNLETGETTDMTDAIVGPVLLEQEPGVEVDPDGHNTD